MSDAGQIFTGLALSRPHSPERDLLITAAYVVVVLAILVQRLTFGLLIRRAFAGAGSGDAD